MGKKRDEARKRFYSLFDEPEESALTKARRQAAGPRSTTDPAFWRLVRFGRSGLSGKPTPVRREQSAPFRIGFKGPR